MYRRWIVWLAPLVLLLATLGWVTSHYRVWGGWYQRLAVSGYHDRLELGWRSAPADEPWGGYCQWVPVRDGDATLSSGWRLLGFGAGTTFFNGRSYVVIPFWFLTLLPLAVLAYHWRNTQRRYWRQIVSALLETLHPRRHAGFHRWLLRGGFLGLTLLWLFLWFWTWNNTRSDRYDVGRLSCSSAQGILALQWRVQDGAALPVPSNYGGHLLGFGLGRSVYVSGGSTVATTWSYSVFAAAPYWFLTLCCGSAFVYFWRKNSPPPGRAFPVELRRKS